MNLYAYVGANPVNSVDPTGLSDLNLLGQTDGLFSANEAMDIPGVYTITGHGNPQLIMDNRNAPLAIRSAGQLLNEMKGYVVGSGQPILIGACNIGKGPIPQDLANLTGAVVYAPNGFYFSPTTTPPPGRVAYQPGDRIQLTVNSARKKADGVAGAFTAVFPADQAASDMLPPAKISSIEVDPGSHSAAFRVDRVSGRIDSQRFAEEDRKKRLGEK